MAAHQQQRFRIAKALLALCLVTLVAASVVAAVWGLLGSTWARVAYLVCEVAFVCFWIWQKAHLNLQPEVHRPDSHKAKVITAHFLQQLRFFARTGPTRYLSPWFHDLAVHVIKRGNVRELLAYGMFYSSPEQMQAAGQGAELEELVQGFERIFGSPLEEGYNPALRFMAHLWEPLPAHYRPLFFYAVMELIYLHGWATMKAWGAQRHVLDGQEYYTIGLPEALPAEQQPTAEEADSFELPEPSCSQAEEPVMFLHGVGIGITPYLGFIPQLMATGRPVMLPYFRNVSMRWCRTIPTVEELADACAAVARAHGAKRVAVIGHSYGSLVASSLVQRHPAMVHSLALLDPVCFGMFMPELVRNFIYILPRSTNRILDVLMWFVSKELHVATTFCRRFYWSNLTLWPEHMPEHTLVVLGGADVLSPGVEIKNWLETHTSAKVVYDPHMLHAEFLLRPSYQRYIMAHIKHMWKRIDIANAASSAPGSVIIDDEDWSTIDASCWEAADAAAADRSDSGTTWRFMGGDEGDDDGDDDSFLGSDDDDDGSSAASGSGRSCQSLDVDALAWLQQAAAAVASAAREQIYVPVATAAREQIYQPCAAMAEAAAQSLLMEAVAAWAPDAAAAADAAASGVDCGEQEPVWKEQGLQRRRGHRVADSAGSLQKLLSLGMGGAKLGGFGGADGQPAAVAVEAN